jgi:hypothetical protein
MSIKIPKPLLFILSFVVALALYWPAMNGTPIWDDFTFWFSDPVMKSSLSYTEIWLRFAWPFSVSVQKLLLALWDKNYFYYHLLCFSLHYANSLLVYRLSRLARLKYAFLVFLLFLLHPVSVISTAWMIQIKTLLCMFFALAAVVAFIKGQKNIRWMIFSWALFAFSILSKSASITLPILFLVYSLRQNRFKKISLLIPFFLFSMASAYRVLSSEVTKEGTEKALNISKISTEIPKKIEAPKPVAPKVEVVPPVVEIAKNVEKKKSQAPTPVPKPAPKAEPKPKPKPEPTKVTPAPVSVQEPKPVPPSQPVVKIPQKKVVINNTDIKKDSWLTLAFIKVNGALILQTLNYYFWQGILPLENTPVKGLNFEKVGFVEYLHIFFLFTLIIIFLKESTLLYFAAAQFLLIPFLGFMPAPYMTVTWVSDQHLYLALPAMIFFWMKIVEKIKWKFAFIIPVIFISYFSYKTYETTKFYRSEIAFYEECVEANPFNIPIVYNLAFAYLMKNEIAKANSLLENTIILSSSKPHVEKNPYFRHVVSLYQEIQGMIYED